MIRATVAVLLALAVPSCAAAEPTANASAGTGANATTASPAGFDSQYTVRYGFAVPSQTVTITHQLAVPPVPALTSVQTGTHPGYTRITFAFTEGFPSYHFGYVNQIVRDATGDPISLPGNSFVAIVFNPAGAAGQDTAVHGNSVKSGDNEGYVSYGIGVAGGKKQLRLGESRRPDGTYVVSVDVSTS